MLLQSIPSQNYNKYTYTRSQKAQNTMSFCGELGDKYIESVTKDDANMSYGKALRKMREHGFLKTKWKTTYMPKSSLVDLLESFCKALNAQNKVEQDADNLVKTTEAEHSALRKEVDNAPDTVRETETEQIRAQVMADLQKRMTELQQLDAQLQEKDAALNDRLKEFPTYAIKNKDSIVGAFRVVKGIKDPEVKVYKDLGEQLYILGKYIKSHSNKLTNQSPNTILELAKVMQNNEGHISIDTLDFFSQVLKAQKMTVENLKSAISVVKDENGNLNPEKADAFLTCHKVIEPYIIPEFEKFYKKLLYAMQNNEGKIPVQTTNFLKNLLEADEKTDGVCLPSSILSVKDENGNMDGDKVKSFFAYFSCKDSSLFSTIEFMQKRYKLSNVYQEDMDFMSERIQKAQELAQKIESSSKNIQATVNRNGLLDIVFWNNYSFCPEKHNCDSNEAFKLIESIKAGRVDVEDTKNLTDVGSLRFIDGEARYFKRLSGFERVKVTGDKVKC